MANLQSQIDILAKVVVNEHVRVSNLQTVSVSDVVSNIKVYDMGGGIIKNTEDEDLTKEYNHQVYELKDKDRTIGTFFGYNNDDNQFSGIWCYDNSNDYVIDQYGDIITCKDKKLLNLVNKSYVRHLGLSDQEYDKSQIDKNENRMVYIDSKTMNVNINGDIVTYNIDTLEIDETNTNYVGCICLNFGDGAIFVLDESSDKIKYLSNGYTVSKDDNGNIIFVSTDNNYVYYKSGTIIDTYKTNLKGDIISNSTTSIGDCAFEGCNSLGSVTISNSVESIGNYAFSGCNSLSSITIPDSVESIGDCAFHNCTSLQEFIVNKNNPSYYSNEDGVLFNKSQNTLIKYPQGRTKINYTIPDYVEKIGESAFDGCSNLISVTIPNSVKTIDEYAFSGCDGLSFITIPNSVKTIGESAFSGCNSLSSITIPNSVESIGDCAFEGCNSLGSVTISNSVESIGNYAFSGCNSLSSITIPDSVESIGNYAFEGCTSLQKFVVNKNNPSYYSNEDGVLFNKSQNTLIKYPQGRTKINYTIPEGVTTIDDYAFYGCSSLTVVIIPDSVTTINEYAFAECTGLTSITIPEKVINIGNHAFEGCTSLTKFVVNGNNPRYYSNEDGVLLNKDQKKLIQYPQGRTETEYTIPNSVEKIGEYAFYECDGLISVTISDSVINIDEYAFSGCNSLSSITIQDSVESIGNYAFEGCTSLSSITIPDSVESIGDCAFEGCNSLSSITIPDSVESIGNYAFHNCTSLQEFIVNKNNPSYYSNEDGVLFNKNKDILTLIQYPQGKIKFEYTIPDYVEKIDSGAFFKCFNLKDVTISNSVKSIGEYAFSGCERLGSVTIPDSVESIGNHAFHNCTSLIKIIIKETTNDDTQNLIKLLIQNGKVLEKTTFEDESGNKIPVDKSEW